MFTLCMVDMLGMLERMAGIVYIIVEIMVAMLDMFVVMVDMIVYVGHDGQVGHNTKEEVEKYRDETFKPFEVLLDTGGGAKPSTRT